MSAPHVQSLHHHEHLAAVVRDVRELVEPQTVETRVGAWDATKHRVYTVVSAEHPSLLDQLRERADPTFRCEGERAVVRSSSFHRSPVDLHALVTLNAITVGVVGWRDRLYLVAAGSVEADLREIVRTAATLARGRLPALARQSARWCEWAWSATGWESKPWIPAVRCPVCKALPRPDAGLRIRLDLHTARCLSCSATWTPLTVRELGEHVAREQAAA